jgi:hypothetical protein
MNHLQNEALGSLANALTDLFQEAVDLLPRMTKARQAGKPFPRRDPARMEAVVSALSFVEDGRKKFLTLAHIDEDKISHRQHISYRQQEELVRIALDAETCRSIEEVNIPGLTRASGSIFGSIFGLKGGSKSAPDAALMDQYRIVLLRNTQSIALRAVFLAHFVRFAIEYIALTTPETPFPPLDPAVPQRHFEAFQRDVERAAPSCVDGPSFTAVGTSLSMRWPVLVIAQEYDSNCDELNGIPMTREHKAAWMKALGEMQAAASRPADLRSA